MRFLSLLLCSVFLFTGVPTFTGCAYFGGGIKPAVIEEGADSVVVNAERAQNGTLDVYNLITKWEYDNRSILPPEVSRAVDQVRAQFPSAWRQSRVALKQYKEQKGPTPTDIDRITAALIIFQNNLLQLRKDANPSEAARSLNALNSLMVSIRLITAKAPASTTSTNR